MTEAFAGPAGRASAQPALWRYHFTDFRSGRLLATLPLGGVKLTEVLGGVGSADAVCSLAPQVRARDPFSATVPRRTVLWAERQSIDYAGQVADSRIMWAGPVMSRQRGLASRTMAIKAVTWEGYLARRILGQDLTYSNVERFTIFRELLRLAVLQPPSDGQPTTSPHHTPLLDTTGPASGVGSDRTYYGTDLKPILEALTNLARSGAGFDWRLEPFMATPGDLASLQVRCLLGFPRLGRQNTSDLRWSSDARDASQRWGHIADLTLQEDGSGVDNHITALGEGQPPDQLRAVAESATEINSGFPLYEGSLGASTADLRTQDSVNGYARGALAEGLASQLVVSGIKVRGDINPVVTSYALGDDLNLRIGDTLTGYPLQIVGQLVGRTINPGEPGVQAETVTLDVQGARAA